MNEKPILEKIILESNKKDLKCKSFLGIGLFSIVAASGSILANPFLSALAFTTLPYIFYSYKKRRDFQNNSYTSFDDVSNYFYKKSFETQFKQYLLNSSSLTEKKYKLLMVSLWLKHKSMQLHEIYPKALELIEPITDEILNKKESQYDLYYLFVNPKWNNDKEKQKNKFNHYDLIKEDENNYQKTKIAQEVYQEYSHIGMLGKKFCSIGLDKFLTISALQGYSLTKQDIKEIEKILKDKTKEDRFMIDITVAHEIISQIIHSQTTKPQLIILKKFIESLMSESFQKTYHYGSYLSIIDKKIKTLKFQDQLEKSLPKENLSNSYQKKI